MTTLAERWLAESGEARETDITQQGLQLLGLAVLHVDEFADAIEGEDEKSFRLWAWFVDFAMRNLSQGKTPTGFPGDLMPDLTSIVSRLEEACEAEAARRGVTLEVWTPERHAEVVGKPN